jgi:hypothetical protein
MNWLEILGVLEIIQLGFIAIIGLLFWMSGKILRGGKEDEKGSRYYVHGLTGDDNSCESCLRTGERRAAIHDSTMGIPTTASTGDAVLSTAPSDSTADDTARLSKLAYVCSGRRESMVRAGKCELAPQRGEPEGKPDTRGVRSSTHQHKFGTPVLDHDTIRKLGISDSPRPTPGELDAFWGGPVTERAATRAREAGEFKPVVGGFSPGEHYVETPTGFVPCNPLRVVRDDYGGDKG